MRNSILLLLSLAFGFLSVVLLGFLFGFVLAEMYAAADAIGWALLATVIGSGLCAGSIREADWR